MFIYQQYDQLKEEVRLKVRAGYHYEQLKVELSLDPRFNKIEYRHFLFNFKSAITELRQETLTEPADVFSLHLARYNKLLEELFTEIDIPGILGVNGYQEPDGFESFLEQRIAVKIRLNNFSKLLSALKQKESLLGFHRSSIKIVIKNTVKKHRQAQDSMLVSRIETRLGNLSLEGQILLLAHLKTCKLSSFELSDIKPKELEAQALSDAVASENLFDQGQLEFKEPEVIVEDPFKTPKNQEDIMRIILENSTRKANETFEQLRDR